MAKESLLAADSRMLEEFLALSGILTGVENLDHELGSRYLDRLRRTPFEPFLRQILRQFRELDSNPSVISQVKKQIVDDGNLRPTICQIILLWYTSAMQDENPSSPTAVRYGVPEEYFSGLAWYMSANDRPNQATKKFFRNARFPNNGA